MVSKFHKKVEKIPLGISGLCVGLGGLSTAWTLLLQERNCDWGNGPKDYSLYTNAIQIFLFIFVFLFWLLIVYRQIFIRKVFWKETNDPMFCSFIPTISMAMMLISGFIAGIPWMGKTPDTEKPIDNPAIIIGSILWYIALALHLVFIVLFFWKIMWKHNFKNDDVYASWFVPPIGIIVSCTVAGNFSEKIIPQELFQAIWFFGFAMYIFFLPYILYKIIFADNIHHDRIPTIAIFGAPANLSLAGFLSIKNFRNWGDAYWVLIVILTILSISTTFFLYICFYKIFKTKFNPTYASLTFPTAIEAVAMLKLSSVFGERKSIILERTFNIIGYIEISVATIIISYVLVRYLWILIKVFFIDDRKNKNC